MKNCPHFECLSYDPDKCRQHDGCVGCADYSSCEHCNRQETIVDGVKIPCEHKPSLPSPEGR